MFSAGSPRQDEKHRLPILDVIHPCHMQDRGIARLPIIRIPAIAERVQRIHGRRQAVGFAFELHMRYN